MKKEETEAIFEDDPRAAYLGTVTGWISRDGYFYGNNEKAARYAGSTHKMCKCGNIFKKNSYCALCHEINTLDRYHAMKECENAKGDMFFSDAYHSFFSDVEQILEFMHENEISLVEDLRLQPTRPNKCFVPDVIDLYSGILPEDGDIHSIPESVLLVFDELKQKLKEIDATLSWEPINAKLSKEQVEEIQREFNASLQ